MNCISQTGRSPMWAAPAAAPTMACSLIGVSITRSAPNCASSPSVTRKAPPKRADVLPEKEHPLVPLHLLPQPLADGLEVGDFRH